MMETTYRMPIHSQLKGEIFNFSYTSQTTIRQLKDALFKNDGIPVDQQRLFVENDWKILGWTWSTQHIEITGSDEDLLINHQVRTASRISVFIRLRGKSKE